MRFFWRSQLGSHRPRRHRKSLGRFGNRRVSLRSIMGATDMRWSKSFILQELKYAIGPVSTGPTLWV